VRKFVVIGLIVLALGAVAIIVPASASQNAPSGQGRALRPGATTKSLAPLAAGDVFVSNDNFFTKTFNHFGNPSLGSVVAESWIETGFNSSNEATNIQGFTRTILLPKALRTAIKVQLFGLIDIASDPELITSSSTVNSSGKLVSQVATPELSVTAMQNDPHCFFFQLATVSIRWSDNRLSSNLLLDPPVAVFNFANPACAPA